MQEFDLARFLLAATTVRNIAGAMRHNGPFTGMPISTYQRLRRDTKNLQDEAARFGFGASLACANRLADLVEKGAQPGEQEILGEQSIKFLNFYMGEIARESEQLEARLLDEMSSIKALVLRADDDKIFRDGASLFKSDTEGKLSETEFDIDEACKCFALGRYTAAVFHLMRAMEAALHVVAHELSATIQNKHGDGLGWGTITSNLKGEIDKMPAGTRKDDWLQAHALLHSVNRAWRVKAAHPKAVYTKEEARVAMDAVRAFMNQLASLV